MVKAGAVAEEAVVAVVVVIHHVRDQGRVAAVRLHVQPRRMILRYRRRKTASKKSVTTDRIRIHPHRIQTAVVVVQTEKESVLEEIVDPGLAADAMVRGTEKIGHDLGIAQGLVTDPVRGIDPAHQDAGLDHQEEGDETKDEIIAVNIAAAELEALVVMPAETIAVPVAAVHPPAEVVAPAVVAGVIVVGTSHRQGVVRAHRRVTTTTGIDALQESVKVINGVDPTNNLLLRGHLWARRRLDSMIDEVAILVLILLIATVTVIGIIAVNSLMLGEDQSRTVVIGIMIEKDR